MYDSHIFNTVEILPVTVDIYVKQIGTLPQNIPLQQRVGFTDNFKIYHHIYIQKKNVSNTSWHLVAFSGIFFWDYV